VIKSLTLSSKQIILADTVDQATSVSYYDFAQDDDESTNEYLSAINLMYFTAM